ncbi:hypothetical protein [Streptomyces sp. HNM0574]|uniref:hypothetical protein n=1 Tax=Streptomyces sp. HNM0574 TaxID=2714954 RepID=UPI001469C41D|nr:hypothetical protein [Streptomyces sp. HNM0574]NLU67281.1 hypothetical protein [Streptomyces sp. HNM0574]
MPVDPTDPDTFEDAYEEEPEESGALGDFEASSADAAEQQADLLRQRDEPMTGRDEYPAAEVDPADAADQARVVEMNEDEYR